MCLLGTGVEQLHWKVLEGTFLTNSRCGSWYEAVRLWN